MGSPITWRNVNAPNFGASNTLLMNATKQLGDAFDSGSQRLIAHGEYNKEKNTGEALAQLGAFGDLDTFAADRAGLMESLKGANIDMAALSAAGDKRRGFLQDNVNFGLDREGKQFAIDNQEDVLASKLAREGAATNTSWLNAQQIQQNIDQSALDRTPEAKQAAVDAEQALAERDQKYAMALKRAADGAKGTGIKPLLDLLKDNPVAGSAQAPDVEKLYAELNDGILSKKILSNIFMGNLRPNGLLNRGNTVDLQDIRDQVLAAKEDEVANSTPK